MLAVPLLTAVLAATIWSIRQRSHSDGGAGTAPNTVERRHPVGPSSRPTRAPIADADVEADIARLKAIRPPTPTKRTAGLQTPDESRNQPDLYARAFVQRLLTQDYRTSREKHLAWVQTESARTDEPLVTGLVPPELRNRVALFSVTSQGPGPAPIPSPAEWDRLGALGAHTTATVQRVTEPLVWSNAAEAGRVSDPGVTAREVTALVTLHTGSGAPDTSTVSSIALTLNLVGPPTRDTWAFVAVITYRAVPMGAP